MKKHAKFSLNTESNILSPLAYRMRPRSLDEFLGQENIIGEGKILRKAIFNDAVGSIILWGPPGSGKTTLASIIAEVTKSNFLPVSAVASGVADLRSGIKEAQERIAKDGHRTILFIDEIHRFNKAQQDAVLPFVENGVIALIGATTENPSFEVISALLSRCRVYRMQSLSDDNIEKIILSALEDKKRGLGNYKVKLKDKALKHLVNMSNGDARVALNAIEAAVLSSCGSGGGDSAVVDVNTVEDAIQKRFTLYDKSGDYHFDFISALHKSLRNSDPDASLYWLSRMIEAGEDPLYIARRLIRFASEDVGLADPNALVQAMVAQQAVHFVGLPEADIALAQAVVYLAVAPKSNSLYKALQTVANDVKNTRNEPVPLHLRNPVTDLMKGFGYGKGYKYAHDFEGNIAEMQCMPENLKGRKYYLPTSNGFEKKVRLRLEYWKNLLASVEKTDSHKPI